MEITNYKQAINYLEGFIGKILFKVNKEFVKKHDPLERMRILLSLFGNPQGNFKSVLVAGTSGKGSTSYLISHMLTTAGYKTGFTLSPHLQKINERLQINGKEISDDAFAKLTSSMIRIIEAMKKMPVGAPSYFEILVGMAFKYFAKEKVDIAVVEVGMGGEFDGTNTLNPLIAVLTNVGLDHTNVLGNTVEKIAKTKAGIIKNEDLRLKIEEYNHRSLITNRKSLVVVSGVTQQSVIQIVEDRCKDVGVRLNLLWRDFGYKIRKENTKGTSFDFIQHLSEPSQKKGAGFISHEENFLDLELSMLGQYQAENASLAIKTILELKKLGFKIEESAVRKALQTAFFPGRFEIINYTLDARRYTLILDGAHNPVKMKEFIKSLKKLYPKERKIFIVGFKFDKDIKKMLKEIVGVADEIIVTQFKAKTDTNLYASADAVEIKNQILKLKSEAKVAVEKDSEKALEKAFNLLKTQYPNNPSLLVVTGSLYLVGEIRSKLTKFQIQN